MAFRRHHDVQQAMSKEGSYRVGQAVVAQRKRRRLINAGLEVQILPTAPIHGRRRTGGGDNIGDCDVTAAWRASNALVGVRILSVAPGPS